MSWYRESELNQFEHVSSGVGKRHSLQGNLHQYWLVCRKHSGCTNILWLQQFLQEIYITGRVTNHKREGLSNSISDGLTVQIIMKVLTQSVILSDTYKITAQKSIYEAFSLIISHSLCVIISIYSFLLKNIIRSFATYPCVGGVARL